MRVRPTTPPDWISDLGERMRRHFALKLFGTTAFIALFFVGYLHVLHHPAYAVTTMPLIALDHLIAFQPHALYAYLSLWLYVGFGPGLQLDFIDLLVYALWLSALSLVGLAIFYFWPTQVPPHGLDLSMHPGFAMLQGVDAAGNACPSLHMAVATFTVLRVSAVLRQARGPLFLHLVNIVWFVAIAYSTLATKQHVVLDVAAGAVLGVAFAVASLRWRPHRSPVSQRARGASTAAA
jgi:membrane-associated phospholipid phosphatase